MMKARVSGFGSRRGIRRIDAFGLDSGGRHVPLGVWLVYSVTVTKAGPYVPELLGTVVLTFFLF